jgi:hypothetical protein
VNLQLSKFLFLVLLSLAPICSARQRGTSKIKANEPQYLLALATANRFLNAWQTGDLETGTLLLSDQARRSRTAESLEKVFARESSRAFEISHGKCDHGACHFPVVMLSGDGTQVRRKFSEIVLIDTSKNDWVVEKLP